eukprot:164086-Pleurochrysis_carterae.AAC.2
MRTGVLRTPRGSGARVPTLALAPPPPRPLGRGRSRLRPRRWLPRQRPSLSVPTLGSTGPCRPRRRPPARAGAGGPAGACVPEPCRAVSAPRPLARPRARPRVSRRGVRGGGW